MMASAANGILKVDLSSPGVFVGLFTERLLGTRKVNLACSLVSVSREGLRSTVRI